MNNHINFNKEPLISLPFTEGESISALRLCGFYETSEQRYAFIDSLLHANRHNNANIKDNNLASSITLNHPTNKHLDSLLLEDEIFIGLSRFDNPNLLFRLLRDTNPVELENFIRFIVHFKIFDSSTFKYRKDFSERHFTTNYSCGEGDWIKLCNTIDTDTNKLFTPLDFILSVQNNLDRNILLPEIIDYKEVIKQRSLIRLFISLWSEYIPKEIQETVARLIDFDSNYLKIESIWSFTIGLLEDFNSNSDDSVNLSLENTPIEWLWLTYGCDSSEESLNG